jgi:lysozyme family protein
MSQFSISYRKTSANEGGYANNPNDHGGETWRGIARKFHSDWEGWPIIDKLKSESDFPINLDADPYLGNMAVKFYHDGFWVPIGGDSITDQSIADHLYDVAVNSGPGTAIRFLQTSLNLLNRNQKLYPDIPVDGKIGPETLGTLSSCLTHRSVNLLLTDLIIEQGCNYRRLMLSDPTQEEFLVSWYNRLNITVT